MHIQDGYESRDCFSSPWSCDHEPRTFSTVNVEDLNLVRTISNTRLDLWEDIDHASHIIGVEEQSRGAWKSPLLMAWPAPQVLF